MLTVKNKNIGGLYELNSEMRAQGIPPHWLSYVAVANVDDTTAKAKATGATVMKEPFDVPGAGRMSVIQDPTGAVFAIWEAKGHTGAQITGVLNTPCWNEVVTPDPQQDGAFYTNLFGWTSQQFGDDYSIFNNGDRGVAGMFQLTPEMGPVPPHWAVYFNVDDCDAIVQKTLDLGGTVLKGATDIPTIGRFAVLMDPQHAAFAIIKPEQPEH